MNIYQIIALAGSVASVAAETFDLGNFGQYTDTTGTIPSLSGDIVWISGQDDGSYEVALSQDAGEKARGILEACANLDNTCYQDLRTSLSNAELHIDGGLNRRNWFNALTKYGASRTAIFATISSLLLSMWHLQHADDEFAKLHQFPVAIASHASVLAYPTPVTVVVEGSPVVTITPTLDPTKLQGSQTPSVTPATSMVGEIAVGDLVACLDQDLASRIDEVMRRMSSCQDGSDFDAQNPTGKRGPGYEAVICGAEGVASMAGSQGTFNDLLLINARNMNFGFADGAGEVARAATVVQNFVLAYAPLLDLGPDVAIDIANFLFALAIDVFIENVPLGSQNRIQAIMITTSTATATSTTATSSGCSPTETLSSCGLETGSDCDTDFPQNGDQEAKCNSGQYNGCECHLAYNQYIHYASTADHLLLDAIVSALNSTPAKLPTPDCQKEASDIPYNIFSSSTGNVYHSLCEVWKSNTALDMRLDSSGENKDPQPHLGRRTPPPNPDSYKDYDFNLHFKPSTGGGSCSKDCLGAFDSISSSCKNGGMNNPMSASGSLDVGCGVFSYDIVHTDTEQQPLGLSGQVCRTKPTAHHGDISWSDQLKWANWLCDQPGSKIDMKPGDKKIQWTPTQWDRDALLTYTISWLDGCTTSQDSQSVQQPVQGATCKTLLRESYTDYNGNEGVDGWRDAGCLRYEFEGHSGS